ncbi:MAG: DUF547 domain-containing protein [Planctomycetes bacterium]|nr:DUF547 domain-containing protein [Planctomycetota bacterium]
MNRFWPTILAFGAALSLGAYSGAASCLAGPTVNVGANVPAAQRTPVSQIDHSLWNGLLRKYVDSEGMVNYTGWKGSAADQQALDRYWAHLSAASFGPEAGRAAQIAYWINAYNAVTVKGILREYPTSSIRNHTPKLFGYHIWKDLHLLVAGRGYSLHQIEHEILRKMGEPRIHFAIVCASIGCPRLLNEAYTPQQLETQLTRNARAFFADQSKFHYDAARNTLFVSPILQWFAEDFGANQAEQMRRISPYLPDEQAQRLSQSGTARVSYLDYDWGLNDRSAARSASRR